MPSALPAPRYSAPSFFHRLDETGRRRGALRRHPDVMLNLPPQAAKLLAAQHAVITRPQLLAAGASAGTVSNLLRQRYLEVVRLPEAPDCPLAGTYRVAMGPATPEQRAAAAVLRCRPRARLSGEVALATAGVEGFAVTGGLLVLVPAGRRVQGVPFAVRVAAPAPAARTGWGCIPAVRPWYALVDVAGGLGDRALRRAVDAVRWQERRAFVAMLEEARRRPARDPGAGRLLAAAEAGWFDQESEGERTLAVALQGFLPELEWGVWLAPDVKVDAFWREAGIVLEYQGRRHHGGDLDRERDRRRHERLRALGFEVVYVYAEDVRRPDALIARLQAVRAALTLTR